MKKSKLALLAGVAAASALLLTLRSCFHLLMVKGLPSYVYEVSDLILDI